MREQRAIQSSTVLTEDDSIPGFKFEKEAKEYTVDQVKRWLKCGKRDELVERVRDDIKSWDHHTLDPSIDNSK